MPHAFAAGAGRADGLTFRPIALADHDFLRALYADVRAAELAPVPWPDAAKTAFLAQQFELQHRHYVANYSGADLLVIEREAQPIGRIYVYRATHELRLMEIALVRAWRGRGVGGALLQELMEEARASAASITLHVEPDNRAQRLYRRLGFRLLEQRGIYDFLGWDPAQPTDSIVADP